MAIAIAEVAASRADLREDEVLDTLVQRWHEWSQHAKDVGVQTWSVLSRAGRHGISAQTARVESAAPHKLTGRINYQAEITINIVKPQDLTPGPLP